MGDFVLKYWVQWLFGIVATSFALAFNCIVKKYKRRCERHEFMELAIQALLRVEIIRIYNKYIELNYLPIYELENVEKLFEQYKNLGGNGAIEGLVEQLKKLSPPNVR